ncbi:MAG: peptidoglycan binding protein CsiV [Porticoccaceae bacterium]|nr:peptidoglycan binding protein CsiV [Porticoccaceae bacterium]
MINHRYAKLIAIFLLTLPGSGFATSFPEEENWHQIEVIIFAQEDSFGIERSPVSPTLGYPDNLKLLNPPEPLYTAVPEDASIDEKLAALMVPNRFLNREQAALATAFAPLDAAQRQLNPDAQALKRQSSYRVLFHEAWQQPVPTRRHAPWIFIRGGDSYGKHTELEGSIRFHHSRFYHMETHLWLSRFKAADTAMAPAATGAQQPVADKGADAFSQPQQATSNNTAILLPELPALFTEPAKSPQLLLLESLVQEPPGMDEEEPANLSDLTGIAAQELPLQSPAYITAEVDVLKDSDQIKRKTLNYIDHPRMGVLVLITPISTEEDNDPEEDFPEESFPEERLDD